MGFFLHSSHFNYMFLTPGRLDSVDWNGGTDWNGMVEWTGLEWNGTLVISIGGHLFIKTTF